MLGSTDVWNVILIFYDFLQFIFILLQLISILVLFISFNNYKVLV